MDNVTPLVHGTKSACNITLDEYQHAFYQQSSINIIAPNGSLLQHIGYEAEKDSNHQMRDQVHLISCLLHNIHHDVDLPQQALYGLADLMYRVQEFCDKKMK
jgi:hypothetical protein